MSYSNENRSPESRSRRRYEEMKPTITITLTQFTIWAKCALHERGAPALFVICIWYSYRRIVGWCETMQMHSTQHTHTHSAVSTKNNFQFSCFSFFVSALDIARASRVCTAHTNTHSHSSGAFMSAIVLCRLTLRKTPPAKYHHIYLYRYSILNV